MHKVILASESPRRKQILEDAGFIFVTKPSGIDEIFDDNLSPRKLAEELSRRKARFVAKKHRGSIVVGADTIVALGSSPLGKPQTAAEAHDVLRMLSGKTHSVFSAFTIVDGSSNREITRSDETLVTFKDLTDEEIDAYVKTGDPMDKAGGYGIQSGAGKFVDHYEGDYLNVIGLPSSAIQELRKMLDSNA